ncbi:DEAD/DEAH box helicase family protein [Marixanthomonas sp. SCSIO 43207]|uniref:DEAD/DEAH box helicase family protein n=1 Tax=Marixanthomonas sp. SCSIO 43207 TaxID=2779360 RepID=UPI001CA8D06C|nr:DEAD/DEAH box helicase family protein [Marixanthomonas sp. SCSIO 43207]UAB82413.1 DEAD/DEAH box helicase family protein [Marixanthomonas sp. SCSIO 43207]
MQLEKQLVLFRYILHQLGYKAFEDLRDEFNNKESGTSSTGYTYFASALMSNSDKLIEDRAIQQYDEAIQGYEKKLRENRAEPFLTFKYYQWFALLFTEYFFDQYSNNSNQLIAKLNDYAEGSKDFKQIEAYTEKNLKKLAYWMATGSGKTLLMHCNYWQITNYFKEWENIILITPNEGLSRQHYESCVESGIPVKLYSGSEESLKTKEGEILILEITKLVKDKEGEGVSVDVDYFSESKNLVFIDEGHKGSKSDEQTWKSLREYLARGKDSFTFEYSATFGQVITNKNKFLFNEYAKSIIFDYSYRHFYTDGYGKDFSVFNLDTRNEYSEEQNKLLLTASLLGYYEQLELFERYEKELRQYNIEKPLWVFVGSRVIGSGKTKSDKSTVSDVSRIIEFFKYALSSPTALQADIDKILFDSTGLRDGDGNDIFKGQFEHLKKFKPIAETILSKVFNGIGNIEAFQVKQAEGEIALKTKTSDQYFAVINIGDVSKYAKTLEADTDGELTIQDDNFSNSLFQAISETNSTINILIGSKKFIEGWNSWRVSSMGLMNMGKNEGAQIIQLFGRGVRLKGKNLSLKREEANAPYHIRALQTISIMGLNASYMNRFLTEIEKEVPDYTDISIEIKLNHEDLWDGKIMTFKKQEDKSFKDELIELEYNSDVANRVTIDMRNKISIAAGGFNSQVAEGEVDYQENFLKEFRDFIDYNALSLEANRYKLLKGFYNLIIKHSVLSQLIESGGFNLLSHKGQFTINEAVSGKIQRVALSLVKDYINKFYADKEKAFLSKYLTYDMLSFQKHKAMFPASQTMIVKVPKKHDSFIKELENKIKVMVKKDDNTLPSIHFDKHLYSPIASISDGKKFKEIKTIPVRLNSGERDFVNHLREFVRESGMFMGKQLFLLRNLSVKGIGFFMDSSSFYPDFILWVVDGSKQYIYFLDPKGILLGDNHFNNPKILWCKEDVVTLENKIQQQLKDDKKEVEVSISGFILSVTPFEKVRKNWGDGSGTTRDDFAKNKVLFIENNKEYLSLIFKNLTRAERV